MVKWLTQTYLLHRAKLDSYNVINYQILQITLCSLWLLPGISWTFSRSSSSSSQLISLSESTLVCSALFFNTCLFASCFSIKWTCEKKYHLSINSQLFLLKYLVEVSRPKQFVLHFPRHKTAVILSNVVVVDHELWYIPLPLVQVQVPQVSSPLLSPTVTKVRVPGVGVRVAG